MNFLPRKLNYFSSLGAALLVCVASKVSADIVAPNDPNIRYVGRFDQTDPAAPRMYWSGAHIQGWFEGTSLSVTLDCATGNDYFYAIVNDGVPQKLNLGQGVQTLPVAAGLADAVHKVEIFKITSFYNDNTAFRGFVTDAGKGMALLPPEPALTIQFYGDSITDGHGVEAPPGGNAEPEYFNNYLAYGAVASRNLGMRYMCTAGTGLAVKHPWPTLTNRPYTMDLHYNAINPYVDPVGANLWSYANDRADIVVVNLFQNDSWVKPTPHDAATANGIRASYKSLIQSFRAVHPNAEIICALGSMDIVNNPVWNGYVNTVVQELEDEGDDKIKTLVFPFINAGRHPIVAEQQAMGDQLSNFISATYPDLFTRDSDGDSISDVREAQIGTDPNDPNSIFKAVLSEDANGGFILSWPAVHGLSYQVERSSDLITWTVHRPWALAASAPEETLILPVDASSAKVFYRVKAATE